MMTDKRGISSKTVKNLQDMEKIMQESVTLQMGKQQTGGMMMDERGISSRMERN